MAPTPSRNNGWSSTLKTSDAIGIRISCPPCFRRTAIVGCQLRAVNGNGNTHFCRRNCLAPNIEIARGYVPPAYASPKRSASYFGRRGRAGVCAAARFPAYAFCKSASCVASQASRQRLLVHYDAAPITFYRLTTDEEIRLLPQRRTGCGALNASSQNADQIKNRAAFFLNRRWHS